MRRIHGFTLIEMLVVVGILLVLLSLGSPALKMGIRSAKMGACASNLHQIYVAGASWKLDHPSFWGFSEGGWPAQLRPYLLNKTEEEVKEMDPVEKAYICPEDEDPESGVGGAASLGEWQIRTFNHLNPLQEGPQFAKLSQTQLTAARAAGKVQSWGNHWNPWPYVPDSNPNVWWLCYEDYGNDWDWKDVLIKIDLDAGEMTVSVGGGTGHNNYLRAPDWPTTPEYLFPRGQGNIYPAAGNLVPDPPSGVDGVIPLPTIDASYGMNADGNNMPGSKVFMLDYEKLTAVPEDDWTTWHYTGNYTLAVPSFARHPGYNINVMLQSGSMQRLRHDEIDPVDPDILNQYWR
ncbi:MAG: prepilin-type N-terminal cleavage/methylation domain-containing protein [Phycisphaerae bacterium]|nr:prepilin-type N-terminal cleavage/methylation domain-containing protein [Phycisphaerae bacterium]